MRIGIIGYGSIGKRHVKNLIETGFSDIILLREKGRGNDFGLKEYYDFESFSEVELDFVLVSNPSTLHFRTILPFIERNKNLLVEKPLVYTFEEYYALKKVLSDYKGKGMVSYNMRFHPGIIKVKELLSKGFIGKVYSARHFVGQYLPDWRPGTDYRKGVSALKALGGGVVMELIHEIDLAIYLFGKPAGEIYSIADKISNLETETEDISEILYRSDNNIIVSIHQDYLNRDYCRYIEIVGEKGTLTCDLKTSFITVKGPEGKMLLEEKAEFERNMMYLGLIKYYTKCLVDNIKPSPSFEEGLESVRVALEVKQKNMLI